MQSPQKSTNKAWGGIFHNPQNTNDVPWKGPTSVKFLYELALSGGYYSLSTNNLLYIATSVYDGGTNDTINAVNPTTGSILWTRYFGNTVDAQAFLSSVGLGQIYVSSNSWEAALNENTGATIWNTTTSDAGLSSYNDGMIFGDTGVALNATNGQTVWNFLGIQAESYRPAVAAGIVYFSSWGNGYIYAVNETTGDLVWSTQLTSCCVPDSPIAGSGVVYVGATDGYMYALNASTGSIVWQFDAGYDNYAEALANGVLLVTGPWPQTTTMYALNAITGSEIWNFGNTQFSQYGVSVSGKVVLVATFDNYLYGLNLNTGKVLWQFAITGMHNQVHPFPTYGKIIIPTASGIYVLKEK
jgi:eukaryotic-like serine/threonine-protein kinase